MGFRFRRRITLLPGVRLNVSRSGISTSVGPRGLSVTLGRRPALNVGLPGTGLSYRESLPGKSESEDAGDAAPVRPRRHPLWAVLLIIAGVLVFGYVLALIGTGGRP